MTDRKLRKLILEKCNIQEIVNYKKRVFAKAVVHNMILILKYGVKPNNKVKVKQVETDREENFNINQEDFWKSQDYAFNIRLLRKDNLVLKKIETYGKVLKDLCEIRQAIKTGDDDKFVLFKKRSHNHKPVIGGREIGRYQINYTGRYVDYGPHLACPRDPHIFEVDEKLLIRETGKRITATYDNGQYYLLSSIYSVFLKPSAALSLKYILGIINSNLAQYYMQQLCFDNSSGAFIKARIFHYQRFPIRPIDFNDKTEKSLHDKIVSLVDRMLELNKKLKKAKTPHEKELLERQIKITDNQIDRLVYELYALTEEEIRVEEGKS